MLLDDEFVATVVGAVIAGVIGLSTVLITQRLESRKRVNEYVLGPAFDFAVRLDDRWPWSGVVETPWSTLEPHRWLEVPKRYRQPLNELNRLAEAYNSAVGKYFEYMGQTGWETYSKVLQASLKKYLLPDGVNFAAKNLGIEGGAVIGIQQVVAGLIPHVMTNLHSPGQAWDDLRENGRGMTYWPVQVVTAIQGLEPEALSELFQSIVGCPETTRTREMVVAVSQANQAMLGQAHRCVSLLASRLRIRPEPRAPKA